MNPLAMMCLVLNARRTTAQTREIFLPDLADASVVGTLGEQGFTVRDPRDLSFIVLTEALDESQARAKAVNYAHCTLQRADYAAVRGWLLNSAEIRV